MALDDDIRVLSGVGLFKGLAEEHLRLLAFGSEKVFVEAGEALFIEGDAADCAYVVLEGRIDLVRTVHQRMDVLASCGPGVILGEMALIAPTQRLTDAIAVVRSQVLMIGRRDFRRILEEYPGVARRLRDQLVNDFQAMVRQLERLMPPGG